MTAAEELNALAKQLRQKFRSCNCANPEHICVGWYEAWCIVDGRRRELRRKVRAGSKEPTRK